MPRIAPQHVGSFRGWAIVAVSLLLLIGSFGVQLCFGVFLKPLIEEFGWSRAAISGAMSLLMGISGVIGVVMGRLTDRYDPRLVIGIGMVLATACYLALATVSSLWQYYLYFGLGGGIAIGSTYTPITATVSKWFRQKRALALGTALMGISVGQMVLSPVAAHIIAAEGWRWAYIVLGAVMFACAVPALFVMRRDKPTASVPAARTATPAPASTSSGAAQSAHALSGAAPGMTTGQAARTAPFWMLMITGIVISAGFYIMAAHIVPAATDLGIAATSAALILTVSSAAGLPGTVGGWWFIEKLGHKYALLVLCAGEGLGLFLFIFTRSLWAFFLVGILFGFCFAAASPVRQAMAPPLFGLRSIGTILGLAYLAWSVGGAAGPFLAGFIFDATQSYDLAFLAGGVLLLAGVVSVYLWGGRTPTKQGDWRRRAGLE